MIDAQSPSIPQLDTADCHPRAGVSFTSLDIPELRDGSAPCPEHTSAEPGPVVGAGLNSSSPSLPSVQPPQSQISNLKSQIPLKRHQLLEGQRRLALILRTRELRAANWTWEQIERALNHPAPTLIRWCAQVEHICAPSAQDCAPQNHKAGRPPKYKDFTPAQIAQIKAAALPINRNYKDTSLPEAIRRSMQGRTGASPVIDGALAVDLLDREARGLPLLTDRQRSQVALTEMEVRAYRSPNEANLDYVQSPGSLMLTRDQVTGEERFWQPGEAYTIDDGSINFGCCVPLERPGDKCWEKFGVIVGRFQFIPTVDHRTRAILGFSFTARPRDSYRAEDLTAAMHTVFAEHGLPRVMFLEYGVSNAKLVNETLKRAGVEPRHVKSPHEKVVEKAFDLLWTKLSALGSAPVSGASEGVSPSGLRCQIGRFRGEMEEENVLLTACKQGHKDPRQYFPSLPQVLAALRQAIAEQNAQWMNSQQYGRWQPGPWFAREAHKVTRQLHPQDAWMFSPVITRPLTVRGFCVQTSVPLMPGFSLKFHFGAEFLADHAGDEVILHFNPFAPECEAMVVHARSGKLLGPAQQINRHARFTRRVFGYGNDQDIGHLAARKHAQALHRTMVAIKVGSPSPLVGEGRGEGAGTIATATAEHRDGLGNLVRAETCRTPSPRGEGKGEGRPSSPSSKSQISNLKSQIHSHAANAQQTSRQAALIRQLAAETEDES